MFPWYGRQGENRLNRYQYRYDTKAMPSILVVDDDRAIRESLLLYLEDWDMAALAAANGEEAMVFLARGDFDVAIVDLRLPGKSGEVFIMDAHQLYPGLKFIIHTGSANYRINPQLQAMSIRQSDVFHKPVSDLSELVESVRKARQPGIASGSG
jgi:two-component system OmpR family response regulator